MEFAIRTPRGLIYGFLILLHVGSNIANCGFRHLGTIKGSIIPRHIRMIPTYPSNIITTMRYSWVGIEIIARNQLRNSTRCDVDGYDIIDNSLWIMVFGVTFTHRDQPLSRGVKMHIRVS